MSKLVPSFNKYEFKISITYFFKPETFLEKSLYNQWVYILFLEKVKFF